MGTGIIYLILGLLTGSLAGYLFSRNKLQKQIALLDKEKGIANDRIEHLQGDNLQIKKEFSEALTNNTELGNKLARAEAEYKSLQEKLNSQKAEMDELHKKFNTEFENIAHKILKQNTTEFTLSGEKSILNPLKEKIDKFERKITETYEKGLKDQTDLRAELKKLHELNYKISEEAHRLTRALKSDVKKMGNWGEIVLERILERSGLKEGSEYQKQFSDTNIEGKRIQPDVVIFLPDNKHIIIDSKVSLVAYERFVNAESEEERQQAIKAHILSVNTHIKNLSEKQYQTAKELHTPDFVLLFLPVESSFSIAVQADNNLFMNAWDHKIVIVSPSTLLATLRTIDSIWKQEHQTKNAQEIARQSGALYDKFVGFVEDLQKIGKNLGTTQNSWNDAMNKLQTGKGNLISRAENIRLLGAKNNKVLQDNIIQERDEEE